MKIKIALGIILVHGYTGSSHDLTPLAVELQAAFGKDSVTNLSLPGHDSGQTGARIPEFNEALFSQAIRQAIANYRKDGRKIVIIGHSTGGNLALNALQHFSIKPDLLIMVSVPHKIDGEYFSRWEAHRTGKKSVPLVDTALMVKLINTTGAFRFDKEFPVLIIHGEADKLVLSSEAYAWQERNFPESARVVNIPQADHDIFRNTNGHLVIDIIRRAIEDLMMDGDEDREVMGALLAVEPELEEFFEAAPLGKRHLTSCPSGQSALGKKPQLCRLAKNDPVIANIEITTYCNLECQFCARSRLNKRNKNMSLDLFRNILALLPNTYKIVLVGLGEPLLHPQIADFIGYAKSLKKKVGLVTNGMLLNPDIAGLLLKAGLDSIAFSIDGFDSDSSSLVRKGTDFQKVIRNIQDFVEISNATRKISRAVFSAVSKETVSHLQDLMEQVSRLGVEVIMLSDVNFKANLDYTLWRNNNPDMEDTVKKAVSHAFTRNLPVLSVHALEEFGLEKRYPGFLLIPPGQLYQRSNSHTWCFSPWQTLPVDVDGNITLCDCQPEWVIGNLFQNSFSNIWNGETLQKYRAAMASSNPPEACKICPRF